MSSFAESAFRNADLHSDEQAMELAIAASLLAIRLEQEMDRKLVLDSINQELAQLVADDEVGARNMIEYEVLNNRGFYRKLLWNKAESMTAKECMVLHNMCDSWDAIIAEQEKLFAENINSLMRSIIY